MLQVEHWKSHQFKYEKQIQEHLVLVWKSMSYLWSVTAVNGAKQPKTAH